VYQELPLHTRVIRDFTGPDLKAVKIDDLPRDKQYAKKGATRILQNKDMYSLYRKVYQFREKEVEKNLGLCAKGKPSNLFADTKEQNGCCRIGQIKMFVPNLPTFAKHGNEIRSVWVKEAMKAHKEKPELDLHISMTSTIVNAEEVYKGKGRQYRHKDELWVWIPKTEMAVEHLKRFLSAFQNSPGLKNNSIEVEFLGANADELALIFEESFCEGKRKKTKKNLPIAVLRYKAGSLNSRKAMVSPFLPTL
jgi:hypothetical protein